MTSIANATEAEREDGIEITPEMIQAGAAVLDELWPHLHDYPPFVVERVYLAMARHSRLYRSIESDRAKAALASTGAERRQQSR
jgi:hypothetical protein